MDFFTEMPNEMKKLIDNLPCPPSRSKSLRTRLLKLRKSILEHEQAASDLIESVYPENRNSARNLIQFLALRTHDLRQLQSDLIEVGLSSLTRPERKVQATLDTLIAVLHQLEGKEWNPEEKPPFCFKEGRQQLEDNTAQLLGAPPSGRRVRIMVTMPASAAEDYQLIQHLMEGGMNCARINCAHDNEEVWHSIIQNVRRAEEKTGRKCRILMDLGGPKLRTGALEPLPAALKVRPKRNELGQVVAASRIWFYPEGKKENRPPEATASLPMPADWLRHLKKGGFVILKDARGANRKLKVISAKKKGCLLSCKKTIYFRSGTSLQIVRKSGKAKGKDKARLIAKLPPKQNGIMLREGDQLFLTKSQAPGQLPQFDETGNVVSPASIACTLPEIFEDVEIGEPIWFDDGKIGGTIQSVDDEFLQVIITHTPLGGGVLRSEKGINLPETNLRLRALTDQDLKDLQFVVRHADMVGLSFANRPDDVEELLDHMRSIHKDIPDVVLKIETRLGFDNLPAMLGSAMQSRNCGVMIARGDLAIECGFGRLAEVQEEMLWTCEAAHVPVIWATQVLEGLAKQGLPTRAEVTDAAMGQRAECIMLNKGPHIVKATHALGDILLRMQDHQTKKRSLLRKLHLADNFFNQNGLVKHGEPESA